MIAAGKDFHKEIFECFDKRLFGVAKGLKIFTIKELATVAGCSWNTAKKHVQKWLVENKVRIVREKKSGVLYEVL